MKAYFCFAAVKDTTMVVTWIYDAGLQILQQKLNEILLGISRGDVLRISEFYVAPPLNCSNALTRTGSPFKEDNLRGRSLTQSLAELIQSAFTYAIQRGETVSD